MLRSLAFAALALCLLAAPLRAAELITLRNGFAYTCDHRETVGVRVRLYSTPGAGSYVEIDPSSIANVDILPDPTAPPAKPIVIQSSSTALTPAELKELLSSAGAEHRLDADLLASIVHAESGGNPRAVSRAGARGLMQLMPQTAAGLGVTDSFIPGQNVSAGTAYFDQLLVRYHDNLALALAAYNAGPLAVDRYHGIPPYRETRAYVARVIHEFNRRKAALAAHAVPQIAPASSRMASN